MFESLISAISAFKDSLFGTKKDTVEKSTGGRIFGEGTPTSDSIPARLSKGEFVIKTEAARKLGYANLERMNTTGEAPQGFSEGGYVNQHNQKWIKERG